MAGNVTPLVRRDDDNSMRFDSRELIREESPTESVYLFSASSLRERARRFQAGFPGAVSYAVKANPEARVVKGLLDQGIRHFDVASLGEIESIAGLGPQATLHFNNPVKARDAVEVAYHRFGVKSFALDEMSEFEKIREATDSASDITYSVRFKLEHGSASYDFGSKFGTSPEVAAKILRAVAAIGARPALTFHPGSQCTDPAMYSRYVEAAAKIVADSGVDIVQLNVGGGFPEQYTNAQVPDLETYFETIRRATEKHFCVAPPLMCEPGRAMVASSVSLLTRVIHVREDACTLFINDGVYGGMLEQSLVDIQLPVIAWRAGDTIPGGASTYQVFGQTCDPVDSLQGKLQLPVGMQVGDYLEFGLMGAYGSATATGFNGFDATGYVNVERGFQCPPRVR